MSRTYRGGKPQGYVEFWSPRPGKGIKGAAAKRSTHRSERQQGEADIRTQTRDMYRYKD